jgi:hypothetical protein
MLPEVNQEKETLIANKFINILMVEIMAISIQKGKMKVRIIQEDNI